jgi:hypothetical protein
MLLELIETLIPKALVFVHPSGHFAERFASKGDEDFSSLLPAFDQAGSFQQLQMLRYRVQSDVERLRDIGEPGWPTHESPNDCAPRGMGNGGEDVAQVIHAIHYTIWCNVMQVRSQRAEWLCGPPSALEAFCAFRFGKSKAGIRAPQRCFPSGSPLLIRKEIFSPNHDIHSYYTAAYIAYRLEFMFRNRRMDTEWKPFRFQIAMAARLVLERDLKLDPKKKRSQAYCAAIDAVMADPDKAQAVFEEGTKAITKAIAELTDQDAKLDRRTAKMRDLKDKLRSLIR